MGNATNAKTAGQVEPIDEKPAAGAMASLTERVANTSKPQPDYRLSALDSLLANPNFKASERNKRFLRFIVEETVAGRSDRIKAFTVAVDVFGRDASFDASTDPIVRIAAGQLRRSLHTYYQGDGRADPVRIDIPLGGYVPVFKRALPWRPLRSWGATGASGRRRIVLAAVGCTIFAGTLGAYLLTGIPRGGTGDTRPVVVVDSARATDASATTLSISRKLTQALWGRLGQGGSRIVAVPEPERYLHVVETTMRLAEGVSVIKVLSEVHAHGEGLTIFWNVLDGRTNEAFGSGRLSAQGRLAADVEALVETTASEVSAAVQGAFEAPAR
ncbi:hypothetical protein [Nitratireductor luteus]|uniref:hypothetical protein n=1 Tax=Nitratireductor luteus TaxID=2976980 RepID=UPI00223F2FA4|nr:hypothetical protein [Nitratireductor luteus]